MLDLEKRTPEIKQASKKAINNATELSKMLECLGSRKCAVRYKSFKVIHIISEDHPEVLYQKWDFFENMLQSKNNTLLFYAIHVLANLAKIDAEGRFERIFDQFYQILNGDALIPACHVAYVSAKIVAAKPELAERVTERLLNLSKASYKHKELVQANSLKSLSNYFDRIQNKAPVIALAKELQKNKSSRAKKEANEFLKKWKIV